MKQIQHNRFSLFYIEKISDNPHYKFESCFEYIDTFDTVEEAQRRQKETRFKTLIINSW